VVEGSEGEIRGACWIIEEVGERGRWKGRKGKGSKFQVVAGSREEGGSVQVQSDGCQAPRASISEFQPPRLFDFSPCPLALVPPMYTLTNAGNKKMIFPALDPEIWTSASRLQNSETGFGKLLMEFQLQAPKGKVTKSPAIENHLESGLPRSFSPTSWYCELWTDRGRDWEKKTWGKALGKTRVQEQAAGHGLSQSRGNGCLGTSV
jgi:hypothetical protein